MPTDHSGDNLDPPPPTGTPLGQPAARIRPIRFPRRHTSDRYLSGVAGGLGQTFGVDPLFLRIGLVAGTLSARYTDVPYVLPLIGYVVAWFVMPIADSDAKSQPMVFRLRREQYLQEAAGALLVLGIAVVLLSEQAGAIPLILVGLSVMLLSTRRQAHPTQAATDAVLVGPSPYSREPSQAEPTAPQAAQLLHKSLSPRTQQPAMSRRQPALWPLTFGLLLIGLLGGVVADRFAETGIRPGIAVNGAILLIGGVLVLSSWRGRARITILWLLPLAPLWVGLSATDTPRFTGFGSVSHSPQTVPKSGELVYELGFGNLDLDLRDLDLEPGSTTIVSVGVDIGDVGISLPPHTIIESDSSVGFGIISIYDASAWHDGWIVADDFSSTIQPWRRTCTPHWINHEAVAWAVATGNLWVADDGNVEREPGTLGLIAADGSLSQDLRVAEFEQLAAEREIVLLDHADGDAYRDEEWLVQVGDDGQFCSENDLQPSTEEPATIRLTTTVGTGKVTIHGS